MQICQSKTCTIFESLSWINFSLNILLISQASCELVFPISSALKKVKKLCGLRDNEQIIHLLLFTVDFLEHSAINSSPQRYSRYGIVRYVAAYELSESSRQSIGNAELKS